MNSTMESMNSIKKCNRTHECQKEANAITLTWWMVLLHRFAINNRIHLFCKLDFLSLLLCW